MYIDEEVLNEIETLLVCSFVLILVFSFVVEAVVGIMVPAARFSVLNLIVLF